MALNHHMETKAAKGKYVTISDMEELLVFARAQGATDDYTIGVDVAFEIRSPARIKRAVVEPPED